MPRDGAITFGDLQVGKLAAKCGPDDRRNLRKFRRCASAWAEQSELQTLSSADEDRQYSR